MPTRRFWTVFALAISAALAASPPQKGILLEDLTWQEAEKILTPDAIVVIPIGAESKEHGPHLKLKNDWLMAEYLKREVVRRASVVVAPTVNYHYYPAFVEYPGSTTLRLETARDLMVDICRSLARYGPRRFYALNTGVSTARALRLSADVLATDGITLRYTDILKVNEAAEQQARKEEGGTHADEIETSMMLFIAPASVDMRKAVKDYHPSGKGGLSRTPNGEGDYSASGVFGDATLATRQKGEILVRGLVDGIMKEIEDLRANRTP
ncbi:MAG TPA: creatininase family protein [Bryobacteraceae bacterium]|nr:creatininase family protein [Bryobacteraceae bacterium]